MEIKWTTTISEEDLREWAMTKYNSKDEFLKVYKEKCKEYEEKYGVKLNSKNDLDEFMKNFKSITNLVEKYFLKEYLWDMVDDSIVEVSSFTFNKEYYAYLVEYSKEEK